MLSIPEIASKIFEKSSSDDAASTVLFVGDKAVGKSTLINLFLDKNEQVRETLILEYSFGRKSTQKGRIEKNVCHVWEYGGNLDMLKTCLTSVPLKGNITFCLMLDLGKVRRIWNTLEFIIEASREFISRTEVEVIIIGAKYDLMKNYDNEIKKRICTTLRSVTLINNYNLFFYSSKDPVTVKRTREVLHGVSFGNGFPVKERVTNINKPIFIPKDSDSWENIGSSKTTFEEVKAKHLSMIPLEVEANVVAASSAPSTLHAEPIIDTLIDSKLDEIRNIFN